jgi:serine protease Do
MSFHQVRLSMKSVVLVTAVMVSSAVALSAPVTAEELSVSAVASAAMPSIARVIAVSTGVTKDGKEGRLWSVGSAFLVTKNGDLVTNFHVVRKPAILKEVKNFRLKIQFSDGPVLTATVSGIDEASDLAVIHVDNIDPQRAPLQFANQADVTLGEEVVAIGYAMDIEGAPTISRGIISGIHRSVAGEFADLIQTDATINNGNSGGPLLDRRGYVIGVNTYSHASTISQGESGKEASIDVAQGLSYARSSSSAALYVRELIERSQVKRIDLGFHAETVPQNLIRRFELPKAGVRVTGVAPGSLSEKAGLRVGDIVFAIEAANKETRSIHNAGELNDALAFLAEEKQLKLYFVRISQQWLDNDSADPIRASDYKLYFAKFDMDETVAIAPSFPRPGEKG